MATIRERLNERAHELDSESLRTRLSQLFDESGVESVMATPFEILGGKTLEEVARVGTDEEKQELELYITYAETRPWYLQMYETQQE
jgi:hypothetical protein